MKTIKDHEWLTISRVQSSLDYNPDTGVFTWKEKRNNYIKIGGRAGQVIRSGYRSISFDRRGVLEHRLAWFVMNGEWPHGEIDHINRDRQDNRIKNLRVVTRSQNMHNTRRKKAPKSGEQNLSKNGDIWSARIGFEGRQIYLGSHKDIDVMRLSLALAKDRIKKGLRPMAASDRQFIPIDPETGEIFQ